MTVRRGPFQLQSGLQLEGAEGRPDGLLRALNMEHASGKCSTRRGQSPIANGPSSAFDSDAITVSPADPHGQTVLYFGLLAYPSNGLSQPGDRAWLALRTAAAQTAEVTITWEFWGADGAWHELDAHRYPAGGEFLSTYEVVSFIVPDGWLSAQPSGTPSTRLWIRATCSGALAFGGATSWSHNTVRGTRPRRSHLFSFRTRAGIRTGLIVPNEAAGGAEKIIFYDVDRGVFASAYYTMGSPFSLYESSEPNQRCASLYVPWTDDLLFSIAGKLYRVPLSEWGTGNALNAAYTISDAEAYLDIARENAVPNAAALSIYGGRVFIGGTLEGADALRWSAPEDAWRTWPSTNYTRLGAKEPTGAILSMIEQDGQLIIFTEFAIWRAVLRDPTAGNESDLFLERVEGTPCVSGESVVSTPAGVCFLAPDGVRVFRGTRSKLLTAPVRQLFEQDSADEFACSNRGDAVGCWHRVDNQYRLFYARPGSRENDTCLVVDLDNGSCWIWGAPPGSALDTSGASGPIGTKHRGVRGTSVCWSEARNAMLAVDGSGLVMQLDSGSDDYESPLTWYAETHEMGIARAERAVLERVELSVSREHFGDFSLQVIPDGDRARADARTVRVESDRLSTSAAIGSVSLAGSMTPLQLESSYAPVRWRGRKIARSHRIRVESVAPAHAPVEIASWFFELSPEGRPR